MMRFAVVVLVGLSSVTSLASESGDIGVIPRPVSVERLGGTFRFTVETRVVADGAAWSEAAKLIDALTPATGFLLRGATNGRGADSVIELRLDDDFSDLGDEGYTLEVRSDRIVIVAYQSPGLFYGIQTLRQLLPAGIFSLESLSW